MPSEKPPIERKETKARGWRAAKRAPRIIFNKEQVLWLVDILKERYKEYFPDNADISIIDIKDGTFTVTFDKNAASENDVASFSSFLSKNVGVAKVNVDYAENKMFSSVFSINPTNFSDKLNNDVNYVVESTLDFETVRNTMLSAFDKVSVSSPVPPTKKESFYSIAQGKFGEVPKYTVKGLALLNHLHGLEDIYICENKSTYIDKLRMLNGSTIPNNFNIMLVRVFPDSHVQPIKIERRNGINNIILIDSLGAKSENQYVKETLKVISEECSDLNVFYTHETRQMDSFSCYVVTAKDLSKMNKTADLYKELAAREIQQSESEIANNIHRCSAPERFVILMQSQGKFISYLGDNKGAGSYKKFSLKLKNSETLIEQRSRHRNAGSMVTPYEDKGENTPRMIDYFAHKWASKIDLLLKTKSPEEISEILEKQNANNLTLDSLAQATPTEEKSGEPPSGYFRSLAFSSKKDGDDYRSASVPTR